TVRTPTTADARIATHVGRPFAVTLAPTAPKTVAPAPSEVPDRTPSPTSKVSPSGSATSRSRRPTAAMLTKVLRTCVPRVAVCRPHPTGVRRCAGSVRGDPEAVGEELAVQTQVVDLRVGRDVEDDGVLDRRARLDLGREE